MGAARRLDRIRVPGFHRRVHSTTLRISHPTPPTLPVRRLPRTDCMMDASKPVSREPLPVPERAPPFTPLPESSPMKSRLIFAVASLFLFFTAECGFSANAPAHPVKVLLLTQSKGYVHSSVNRSPKPRRRLGRFRKTDTTEKTQTPAAAPGKEKLSPAEIAMTPRTADRPVRRPLHPGFRSRFHPRKPQELRHRHVLHDGRSADYARDLDYSSTTGSSRRDTVLSVFTRPPTRITIRKPIGT